MKKLVYTFIIIGLVFLTASVSNGQTGTDAQNDELSYAVNVNAQLVPVYAVDKNGDPVFDLKQEEIQLYADGKPVDVFYFSGYTTTEQVQVPGHPVQKTAGQPKNRDRMNFIIIDSLISNLNIFKQGCTIAAGIIKNAAPNNWFVIMESNQISGFQYIAGPEKDKEKLIQAIQKIEHRYFERRTFMTRSLFTEYRIAGYAGSGGGFGNKAPEEITSLVIQMQQKILEDNKDAYGRDISLLAQSLKRLKYVLRSLSIPKTVFLIAGNVQKYRLGATRTRSYSLGAKYAMPITYYRFLEGAAKAINRGGSMFYLINPLSYRSRKARSVMKFITDAGTGKLIHGTSIPEIVENVRKSTSAYYEMAFYPDIKPGTKTRIKVKCKRKGVELISIGYAEKEKAYARMNGIEKKLFALDIVNRGNWSRRIAKVGRVKYSKSPGESAAQKAQTIRFTIPPVMRNRTLETVLVYVNPGTLKATFERKKVVMGDTGELRVPFKKGREAYFLVIEPKTPVCIYNRVI